jgi:hypothetical protein
MKDRALRRHQDLKVKRKAVRHYNSCIEKLSHDRRALLEKNIEKLKKVCAPRFSKEDLNNTSKKTVQELKHDITMREQLY